MLFSPSMGQDNQYQEKLTIPTTGLNLKTKIYVAVKATKLSERYFTFHSLWQVTWVWKDFF